MGCKYSRGMRLKLYDGVEVVVDSVRRSCHGNSSFIVLRRVDNGEIYRKWDRAEWTTKMITKFLLS